MVEIYDGLNKTYNPFEMYSPSGNVCSSVLRQINIVSNKVHLIYLGLQSS